MSKNVKFKKKFPFLIAKQRQFVKDFYEQNEYLPSYFLLYNFLKYSDNRSDKLYCLYHGIFDNLPQSLDSLSELYSLSRERIRQLINGNSINAHFMLISNNDILLRYSNIFKYNIISEKSYNFTQIIVNENLNISFRIFAALTCVIANYSITTIKNKPYLISGSLNENIKIKKIIGRLDNILKGHYSKETVININSVLYDVPNNYLEELRAFLLSIVSVLTSKKRGFFSLIFNYFSLVLSAPAIRLPLKNLFII